ncbi:hypothetical protein CJP72_05855 [Citrobacter sp. NCU1]|nr:hypothetical protein [Citrobacter sp. NCU1]
MLSETGFTHNDLLRWQNEYAGRSLNMNGTIMRDTYMVSARPRHPRQAGSDRATADGLPAGSSVVV